MAPIPIIHMIANFIVDIDATLSPSSIPRALLASQDGDIARSKKCRVMPTSTRQTQPQQFRRQFGRPSLLTKRPVL